MARSTEDTALADQRAIRVRRAELSDLASIVALDTKVTGIAKPEYLADLFERYRTRRAGERFFFIAESADSGEETQILGFVIGEIRAWEFGSAPCGWVIGISVDPGARSEHIGHALMTAISAAFRDAGITIMRTMISRKNHLLMSFFRGEGMMAGPYLQLEKELDR